MKDRLSTARTRALAAREELSQAKAEAARGIYHKATAEEQAVLDANQSRAQQGYDAAMAAIEPLVEEARSTGLDPSLIEFNEESSGPR